MYTGEVYISIDVMNVMTGNYHLANMQTLFLGYFASLIFQSASKAVVLGIKYPKTSSSLIVATREHIFMPIQAVNCSPLFAELPNRPIIIVQRYSQKWS